MASDISAVARSIAAQATTPPAMEALVATRRGMSARLVSRWQVFAGLAAVGFLNAISERVLTIVAQQGMGRALMNTFDVSLVLWGGCLAAIYGLLRAPAHPVLRRDRVIMALCALMLLVPIPALGSLSLALLAIYLVSQSSDRAIVKSAVLLAALTMPLFWDRLLIALFSDPILHFDAMLVGWLIGMPVSGNVIPLPDGTGSLFVAPACSSVANLSLVAVTSAIFAGLPGRGWSASDFLWTGLCGACIVAINVTRISLIGLYPAYFDLIHGDFGATIANCLTLLVLLTIGYHRIGRHGA